ncbi:MAG TPA: CvpA family protein [Chitinophagaceae bacterium]|nr:CvpA family protein [Chitinophagaceae bacterium]
MVIDIILLVLLAIACFKGYSRGLIVAIFSFLAVIIGLAAAMKFSVVVSGWLQNSTHISKQWLPFISFLVVMIAVVILVRLVANMLQKSVEFVMLGWVNRLGGIVFYVVIYVTVYSIVLFYGAKMNIIKPGALQSSQTYAIIEPIGPRAVNILGTLIPVFKDMFTDLETFFGSLVNGH